MTLKLSTAAYLTLAAVALTVGSGCVTSQGPYLGAAGIPIPVSPFFQDRLEDESWEQERYNRMPILGPLTEDSPDIGMDEPSDAAGSQADRYTALHAARTRGACGNEPTLIF